MHSYIVNPTDSPYRNRCKRCPGRIRIAVLALGTSLLMSCVASPSPPGVGFAVSSPGLENIDLTDVSRDKRKFLIAVSMLGQSLKADLDLLQKMTGYRFDPKPEPSNPPPGERRFRESAPLFRTSALLISGTFWYRLYDDDRYHSVTGLRFNKDTICITTADLHDLFGPPSLVDRKGPLHGKGLGPSGIWTVVYRYPSGMQSVFAFSTDVCVNDVTHSSIPKELK